MTKTILHIATTIDGFIADNNGNSDFAIEAQKADENFKDFYDSVGAVVMGRRTYDYLKNQNTTLFEDKPVYVITHYLRQQEDNVTFIHEDIKGCVTELKNKQEKNVWILGGSEIANILLKEHMIDEVVLTVAPVILGGGTRLFKDDNPVIKMKLDQNRVFDGFVQNIYHF